ncbi:MAG: type II secretion system protein GspD [Bryobacteraceae bacterium]
MASWAGEPSARSLAKRGEKAEKGGNVAEAVLLYNQAAAKGSAASAGRAGNLIGQMLRGAPATAASVAAAATPEEPDAIFAPITERDVREARELLPPPELSLPANEFVVDLREDARKIWESAGKLLGLEVLFDADYEPGTQPVRFQCTEQSARQVLHGLSAATGSFVVVLGPKQIMVVKDTLPKRQEREPTVAVLLSLPDPTTTQELQELARAVQQVMEIQKFAVDSIRRMVMMRDRVSKVRPAQKLFEQLLGARPMVVVELELYEMRSTRTTELGIGLPTSTKLFWLSRFLNNDPDKVDPGAAIATFGAGNGLIGMTIADATVTATALKSFGTSVQRAFVQSVSGQPAQLIIGEKYPILTGGYSFGTGSAGDLGFALPPSFQFENLGLTLKVTPYVHDTEEMTLEVEAEFKLLTGAEINGIPILANRKFTSRVRMRDGQWALLGGLAQDSKISNITGIPGLMQLPFLGRLLRTNSLESNEGAVMMLLKPRLLGSGTDLAPGPIFLGPEGRPAMPL